MQINILSPGKFKTHQEHKKIFEYYKKRIKIKVNLLELKLHQTDKKLDLEKKEILKYLKKDDYVFILDKNGDNLSSINFSKILREKVENNLKNIDFIIGSDAGLDNYFDNSFRNIGFGKQTWPHLLVRVMLIEQIYRAFEIMKRSGYHK